MGGSPPTPSSVRKWIEDYETKGVAKVAYENCSRQNLNGQERGNTLITVIFGISRTPCKQLKGVFSEVTLTSVMKDCWREDSMAPKMGPLRQDKPLISLSIADIICEL